jgi:hypothetical protein
MLQAVRGVGAARLAACALAAALAAAAQAGAAPEEPPPQEPPPQDQEAEQHAPTLLLKGFGDINFARRDDGTPSAFSLGELDFFVTSEIAPGLSVLAEIVFEPEEDSTPVVELERYVLKYAPRDYLQVAVGRMHTLLGYWNQTYHHGAWFQTTIERPVVYRWEHDGGVLPVHEVGLQAMGSTPLPGLSLEYNAGVSNGRGYDPSQVQELSDANSSKAVNLWLGIVPHSLRALKLGGAVRFDRIPVAPAEAGNAPGFDERILGGFIAYTPRRAEILAEVMRVEHEARDTGETWRTLGLYVQGAVRFGRFKPYYRYDHLDIDENEPYYGRSGTLDKHALGVRYDAWSWGCLKLELVHEDSSTVASFGAIALQAAFTF